MPSAASKPFLHHHNQNGGLWESICARCFRTIAKSELVSDLLKAERSHICEGFSLDYLDYPQAALDRIDKGDSEA